MADREDVKRKISLIKGERAVKKAAVIAGIGLFSLFPKFANAQTQSKTANTFKTEQTVGKKNAQQVTNNKKSNTADNETGLKAAAAELAGNADFMANFLLEEGENIAKNFDMKDFDLTAEMTKGIENGSSCEDLNRFALSSKTGNPDGHHCYRGTKDILKNVGINLSGENAYEAVGQLRALPQFTEIKCDYDMLPYVPKGSVVVQGKGNTKSGHIFVVSQDTNGNKFQRCGRTYPLPKSNLRNRRSGQRYGGLYVFIPSDCKLDFETTLNLYREGNFNISAEDMIYQRLKDDKGDKETEANKNDSHTKNTNDKNVKKQENQHTAALGANDFLRIKNNIDRGYNG